MKRVLRWVGIGLGAVVGLLAAAVGVIYGVSEFRLSKKYEVPAVAMSIRSDPELVARGEHVATVRGCVDCHTASLGGQTFIDVLPIGRVFASNLTAGKGGIGARYSDADLVRAIRHGVRPDGSTLLVMPSQEFHVLSDEDVGALVAYIRSLPPVDNEPVDRRVGPLGRFLYLKGDLPLVPADLIDHRASRPAPPAEGPTAEYGAYLVTGCLGCHGHNLSGGRIPGMPPSFPAAANITLDVETGIGRWTEADFFRALREGKRPDGSELRPEMPWKLTAQMTDDEIRALWLHLQGVPVRPEGNR